MGINYKSRVEHRLGSLVRSLGGFSLLEAVVVAGVIGAMGLTVSQMSFRGFKSVQNQEATSQFVNLVATLQSAVQNDSTCGDVLKLPFDISDASGLITEPSQPQDITIRLSGNDLTSGQNFGAVSFDKAYLNKVSTLVPQSTTAEYNVNADLIISMTKTGSQLGGKTVNNASNPIRITLKLRKLTAGYKVLSCSGVRFGSSQDQLPSCDLANEAIVSDGTSFQCKKKLEGKTAKIVPSLAEPSSTCSSSADGGNMFYLKGAGLKFCAPVKRADGTVTGYMYKSGLSDPTKKACSLSGGTWIESVGICRFNSSNCPTYWMAYGNWTTTESQSDTCWGLDPCFWSLCYCTSKQHPFDNVDPGDERGINGCCNVGPKVTQRGCIFQQ